MKIHKKGGVRIKRKDAFALLQESKKSKRLSDEKRPFLLLWTKDKGLRRVFPEDAHKHLNYPSGK